jgi:hypothetical protein
MNGDLQGGDFASDVESLDAIAEQCTGAVNHGTRNRYGSRAFGPHISPSLERIFVRREAKQPVVVAPAPPACNETIQPEPFFAAVTDYDSLVTAMRLRAEQLQICRQNIDEIAGWADRLAVKLLSPPPIKTQREDGSRLSARRLGPGTLGPMLAALGMKLIAVEDPETLELHRHRRTPRNASQVRQQPGKPKENSRSRSRAKRNK